MSFDIITTFLMYINGGVDTFIGKLSKGIWDIFSMTNGGSFTSNGITIGLGIFFSVFLCIIIQLQTKIIYDKKHFIALTGVVCLVLKYLVLLIFEWGWEINLYDDEILHLLYPPLEHFFQMLFVCCIGYYSLNVLNYYPGILKKILYLIPIVLISFFIYTSITWKKFFYTFTIHNLNYELCPTDYQTHFFIAIISLYVLIVSICRFKNYFSFLAIFWFSCFFGNFLNFITLYFDFFGKEISVIIYSIGLWSLPVLTLHFINTYVIKDKIVLFDIRNKDWASKNEKERCSDCPRLLDFSVYNENSNN